MSVPYLLSQEVVVGVYREDGLQSVHNCSAWKAVSSQKVRGNRADEMQGWRGGRCYIARHEHSLTWRMSNGGGYANQVNEEWGDSRPS
jgi:hypothetical protein